MSEYRNRFERMNKETINDTIIKAVTTLTRAMEPKINAYAIMAADKAVREGRRVAQKVYRRVRREPWYLVGAATLLLIAAAVFFKTESSSSDKLKDDFRDDFRKLKEPDRLH